MVRKPSFRQKKLQPGTILPVKPDLFEQEVRRLAREMWPRAGGEGPVMLNGRERDGVFVTADTIHILEATTERKKSKAEGDIKKSIDLKKELSKDQTYESHNYKIWFITRVDPTADQMTAAAESRKKARCPVAAMSARTFQDHLMKASGYLQARLAYPFGSVRNLDPTDISKEVPVKEFVPLGMVCMEDSKPWEVENLIIEMQSKFGFYLLLGDFGAGKSMTMRHLFHSLRKHYLNGDDIRFPVFLNLSDHIGQDDPASALYDHATKIGFAQPDIVNTDDNDQPFFIRAGELSIFEITGDSNLELIVFRDCLIGQLYLDGLSHNIHGPKFESCLIDELHGATSRADLPMGLMDENTEIMNFRTASNVAAELRRLPLSPAMRVLLVTLRKLFQQSGKGRKANAFNRGLGDEERPYVDDVLSLLKSHKFAEPHKIGGNFVWIPNRTRRGDALTILGSPNVSTHQIVVDVQAL